MRSDHSKLIYSLRRWTLAISGAESQLITLWVVDDFATKDLMSNYYQRLQKNMGRSAALRQVQLEMLKIPNISVLIIGLLLFLPANGRV